MSSLLAGRLGVGACGRPSTQRQASALRRGGGICCPLSSLRAPAAAAPAPRLVASVRRSQPSRRAAVVVRAVFEKFSERSIKSVMIAQQEAKNLGAMEVRPRRLQKLVSGVQRLTIRPPRR